MQYYGTMDEVIFLHKMAIKAIQLTSVCPANKASQLSKLYKYYDTIELRDEWGKIDKSIIIIITKKLIELMETKSEIIEPIELLDFAKRILQNKRIKGGVSWAKN